MNPVTVLSAPMTSIPTQCRIPQLSLRDFGQKLVEHFGKSGARPVEITARTIPSKLSAACPFRKDIVKYAQVNVFVNVNYEAAVNRKLTKVGEEADFVAGERKNGLMHVEGTPFLRHEDGTVYLRCMFPKSHGYRYMSLDGQREYNATLVHSFMYKSSNRQGLSEGDEIRERDYKLENITACTIDGVAYLILPDRNGLVVDDLRLP